MTLPPDWTYRNVIPESDPSPFPSLAPHHPLRIMPAPELLPVHPVPLQQRRVRIGTQQDAVPLPLRTPRGPAIDLILRFRHQRIRRVTLNLHKIQILKLPPQPRIRIHARHIDLAARKRPQCPMHRPWLVRQIQKITRLLQIVILRSRNLRQLIPLRHPHPRPPHRRHRLRPQNPEPRQPSPHIRQPRPVIPLQFPARHRLS